MPLWDVRWLEQKNYSICPWPCCAILPQEILLSKILVLFPLKQVNLDAELYGKRIHCTHLHSTLKASDASNIRGKKIYSYSFSYCPSVIVTDFIINVPFLLMWNLKRLQTTGKYYLIQTAAGQQEHRSIITFCDQHYVIIHWWSSIQLHCFWY